VMDYVRENSDVCCVDGNQSIDSVREQLANILEQNLV
jgi:hypothetical protein